MSNNQKDSLQNQKIASNPNFSVWVSASAGTGKTTVLVNRLLRLFLNDVEPSKVLCLTYTNAGAIEMQNRIYNKTRDWATIPDNDLYEELKKIQDDSDTEHNIDNLFLKARKLFSKLIDNPVPLKIYTIHAFCQSVLKRFPIEAGISPHFKIIEDSDAKLLLNQAYQKLIQTLKTNKNISSVDTLKSFDYLISHIPESNFDDLIKTIIDGREHFFNLLTKYNTKEKIISELKNKIFSGVDFVIDDFINNENLFLCNFLNHIPSGFIENLKQYLKLDTGKTTLEILQYVSLFLSEVHNTKKQFEIYKSIFLTAEDKIRSVGLFNKKSSTLNPKFVIEIEKEAVRVKKAVEFLKCIDIFNATSSIVDMGLSLNNIYQELKSKNGVMDFSDLITIVRKLLNKPNISSWILYKLDEGISHVLIDEAQDTSPIQWEIVDKLTEEFFTTGTTKNNVKSLFSVGDRKQSIFSFQGANIKLFEKYKHHFKNRIETEKYPFYDLPLNKSFRSCKNILNVVDSVIKNSVGVLLPNEQITHYVNRDDSDGIVEIMPLVKKIDDTTKDCFKPPVENIKVFNTEVEMANVLACKIRDILDNEYISDGKKDGVKFIRKIEPKDIMILVKKRKYADSIVKALVSKDIPVAGRDKLSLSDNIVVQDLISLLKFVLFNYDDLSLAEILKSPLYNLNDNDLFELCYERGSNTLLQQLSYNVKYKNIYDDLCNLVSLSKKSLPFEFFDYILKVQNKKQNFILRFGEEINDVLNAFLSECLSYDNLKLGKSLSDFYEWFESNEIEIKRNMEQVNNTVRIMTVHSSKGLEAPVVFLYNANAVNSSPRENIIWSDDFPLYKISGFKDINENFSNINKISSDATQEEFYRLLYVAMTRVRDRLYVLGAENAKSSSEKSWYSCIKDAVISNENHRKIKDKITDNMFEVFAEEDTFILGSNEEGKISSNSNNLSLNISELPKFLMDKVKPDNNIHIDIDSVSPLKPIEKIPMEKGKIIHRILEHISKFSVDDIEKFLDFELSNYEFDDMNKIKNNILYLYNNPKYNFLFSKNNLSETEIIISENNITKILRVDKVVFDKDYIRIIDYKTDKYTKNIPNNYKIQLQTYKNAISKIYPDKKISATILWINDLEFTEII